jgi:PAS domain S-box-containing protein
VSASAANALIQSSLLGEAVDNGPVAVFVVDENRRFVAVSRAACDLVGYSREDMLTLDANDLADGSDRWDEIRRVGKISGIAALRRSDGSRVEYRYVAAATKVAGMPVFVSVGATA